LHMLIAAIVRADNKTEAKKLAEEVFEDLVDANVFDYYTMFDDEWAKNRWGECPPVLKLESEEGKELLKRLLDATRDELFENLRVIRRLLQEYDDEDIWYGDNFDALPSDRKVLRVLKYGQERVDFENSIRYLRHCCLHVGEYIGTSIFLYDWRSEGIRSLTELKGILEKEDKSKLWIVPADVHF